MLSLYKHVRGNRLGRFICSLLLILCFTSANARPLEVVSRIIDGDTLVLQSGESIRLLGINAPEVKHHGRASERGGLRAKQYLQKLLAEHQVYMEYDVETLDHYGRRLAYIFLDNGLHVNAELLRSGMATLSIHPPNIKYSLSLSMAQKEAESRMIGVWSQASHQLKFITGRSACRLKQSWGRFRGRVKSIKYTKKGAKLYLSKGCYIWISASHYRYFSELGQYLNRELEIRAWVKKWGREWSMRVTHSSQIILEPN